MKKNNIRTITALTALLALAACGDRLQTSEPVELRFTSGLQMQTRAAYVSTQNTQIVSGEKVYAWVDEAVPTPGTPVEYVHAWELTADGSGALNGTRQNYPNSGYPVNAYALHGDFGSAITAGTTTFPTAALTHSVGTNQGTQAALAKSDLLWASGTGLVRQTAAHTLTFSHLLAKIEVYLVAGTGTTDTELESAVVTIQNTIPTATVTLSKSAAPTVAVTTDPVSDITCFAQTETDQTVTIGGVPQPAHRFAEAVIVPQAVNNDFIKVSLGATAYYTAKVNTTFAAGNRYSYYVVVNKAGISLTTTITAWGDGGTQVVNAK